ncbi:MAG: amidohydrolase family protein [Chloroflexi bacterium]|nr:amidohydrolase family protein [Chloroflexota bacterium]
MAEYELAIVGGTVVTAQGEWRGEIAVTGGRIAALAEPGTPLDSERTLDAGGRHVLPGVIDPHVHMPSGGDFAPICERETSSFIRGGVTSAMVFVAAPDEPYGPVLARQIAAVGSTAYCHVAFSPIIESMEHVRELPRLAREHGATSYKMYFAAGGRELYPATVAVDDGVLYEALGQIAALGDPAIAMVHAENWEIAAVLAERLRAEGRRDPAAWSESRPNALEEECMRRAAYYAERQRCPLYVVHMSTAEGPQVVREARSRGVRVDGETCPHYLEIHAQHERAALAKYNPAIKWRADNEALWRALGDGGVSCMGSDHIPIRWEQKSAGGFDDIWETRGGVPGSATILPLLLARGVNEGRLTLPQVAAVTSGNAARLFGLSGKGRIEPGADADLVVVDLDREVDFRAELLGVDYSLFEGERFRGWPVATVLAGRVVMEEGEIAGSPGDGRYLRRELQERPDRRGVES